MQKQMILIVITFLFAVAIAGTGYAPPPPSSDLYVSPDGNDGNTGGSTDPFQTIGKGVDEANPTGTIIHLSEGTFDEVNDRNINIAKDLTIQGAGKDKTFIDAEGFSRVFRIDNGNTVTIKDVTFLNGDSSKGGAIKVRPGATLNLINCNFIGNTAEEGGAIYNFGTTTATNCLFKNNVAEGEDSGGAIYSICGSTLTVTGSTFQGNSAADGHGGAIFVTSVMLKLIGNNFIQNTGNAIYIMYFPISNGGSTNGALLNGNSWAPSYTINVNRIVKNTDFGLYIYSLRQPLLAAAGNGVYPIDATNNWWGSNNDPRTLSNAVYDPMNLADLTKWLVLKIGASPNKVPFGSTSLVTASVIYNNLGEDTSSIGHIPDGTPITITTDIGNVGSKQVTRYTVNGIVTTILRADDGLGTANIYAILDGFKIPLPAQVIITAAASEVGTIGMQETGMPLAPAVLALLMVIGGAYYTKRK